jgi:hypothetical protein
MENNFVLRGVLIGNSIREHGFFIISIGTLISPK